MTSILSGTLYARELEIERESADLGVERYQRLVDDVVERGDAAVLKPVERLLVHWFKALSREISAEKTACSKGRAGIGRAFYSTYISRLSTGKLAVLTMHEVLSWCVPEPLGVKLVSLANAVGRAAGAEIHLALLRKEADAWEELMHSSLSDFDPKVVNRIANRFWPEERWPVRVQIHLGACLIGLLIKVAATHGWGKPFVPALKIYVQYTKKRTETKYLKLTPEAEEVIREGHHYRQFLKPRHQPMVVPPISWSLENRGGYLEAPLPVVKWGFGVKPAPVAERVYDAMNCVNHTAWRINKRVLDVMLQVWDEGGVSAGVPRLHPLPRPPLPDDFQTNKKSKRAWKRKVARLRTQNIHWSAEAKNFLSMLRIAKGFKDYERFYFPHQLDFRGRAYPVSLFLNHQGDDCCRGILEFARPVTVDNPKWLEIHVANCCGIGKVSLADRGAWVADNLQRFRDWNADPLSNSDWMAVDKPWQALAAAFALCSDDVAAHLPVQVDGSSNALQHYGAMLRCEKTAPLVNLVPSDAPAKLYAIVADKLQRSIARHATKGEDAAIKLEGWITEKVIKQTVMTTVYGVTEVGARRQIHAHLKKAGFHEDELYEASKYLGKLTRQAVGKTCVAAYHAMNWLTGCARVIAKSGEPARWTSPIGLNVEQPYRNPRKYRISTMLHSLCINETGEDCPVSIQRQANGLAPNYVHSLDASHMMMTAIAAREQDITFAAVHDSYWTHASTMDKLNKIIREQFIQMHRNPLHLVLYGQFVAQYPGLTFPKPPPLGGLDINLVRDSTYFFS